MEDNLCYVCQCIEEEENKFCDENICDCKGSNKIHVVCFRLLPDKKTCSICKQKFINIDSIFNKFPIVLYNIEETDKFGWKHSYQIDQFERKQGLYRIYYMNGKLWEESQYRDDKRHGYHKVWSYQGKLFLEDYYFKDEKL
jgi:hypothetical protein